MSPTSTAVALLLCSAPIVLFPGATGLMNPDEGRYAEIAREMAVTGDWLVPRLEGVPHWAKPPGFYWAAAASFRAFGYTATAARLPSILAGVAAIWGTFLLVDRLRSRRAALFAAAALGVMGQPFVQFRAADPNALQAACVVWALYFFVRARGDVGARFRPGLFFAGASVLGVAFVVKGPIALFVVAAAFATDAILARAWRTWTPRDVGRGVAYAMAGLAIVAAIGLPWFLRVVRLHPELTSFFVKREMVDRYFTDEHARSKPFWFFAAILPAGLLPWTAVFAGAAIRAARSADRGVRFLFAWALGGFVLFHLGTSKLFTYLLPMYPACAALVGVALAERPPLATAKARFPLRFGAWAAPSIVVGAGTAFIIKYGGSRGPWFVAAAVALAGAVAFEALWRRPSRRNDVAWATIAVAAVFAVALHGSIFAIGGSFHQLGEKSDTEWVRDALAADGAAVRGVPLTDVIRPTGEIVAPPRGTDRLVTYVIRIPSLAFDVLRDTPETIPAYQGLTRYELKSDAAADPQPTTADLVGELEREERTYVLTRRAHVAALEAAVGRRLPELAAVAEGKRELVLLRSR
jgi:4-amino-4-deoxy-L-arabinose transferase-like glycosyltransferase